MYSYPVLPVDAQSGHYKVKSNHPSSVYIYIIQMFQRTNEQGLFNVNITTDSRTVFFFFFFFFCFLFFVFLIYFDKAYVENR